MVVVVVRYGRQRAAWLLCGSGRRKENGRPVAGEEQVAAVEVLVQQAELIVEAGRQLHCTQQRSAAVRPALVRLLLRRLFSAGKLAGFCIRTAGGVPRATDAGKMPRRHR